MTIISKASVWISASDNPQNGDFSSISWQIIRGVTKKSLSAPVLNPILISVWSKGMNSPSEVCFDRTNFARILHWTINEFRRLPTLNITTQFGFWSTSTRWRQNMIQLRTHRRAPYSPENTIYLNMKQYFPSLWAMTALSENINVSVRFFGFEILMKMQPTINASINVPSRHWITNRRIASGHSSVIDLRP